MKLHLMSDLHLEFAPLDLPGGDVLLLAGDIIVADYVRPIRTDRRATIVCDAADAFFEQATSKYKTVNYILGNHEHYGSELNESAKIIQNYFNERGFNVNLLENDVIPLNDEYMLYGATFWTDYNRMNPIAMQTAENGMNDHRRISYQEKPLRAEKLWNINHDCRSALKVYVEQYFPDKKFIVMSHHCPDLTSCHPKYGVDVLNYAYCNVGLSDFILDHPQITHWFHGHTHDSFNYMIGDCNVICNPRGYAKPYRPSESENFNFDINLTVEI